MDYFIFAYLFVHTVLAVASLIMIRWFAITYSKHKIDLLLLLIGILVLLALTNIIIEIPELIPSEAVRLKIMEYKIFPKLRILDLIGITSLILTVGIFALMIVFIEGFHGEVSVPRTGLAIGALYAMALLALASMIFDSSLLVEFRNIDGVIVIVWTTIAWIGILLPATFLIYWALSNMQDAIQNSLNEQQRKQIIFMRRGVMLSFFIGPAVSGLGDTIHLLVNPTIGAWLAEIVGYSIIGVGVLLVSLAYYHGGQPGFLQGQRIEQIIVITKSGIPIYTHRFKRFEWGVDVELLSGFFSALQSAMVETLQSPSLIRLIKLKGSELIVHVDGELTFLLVASKTSVFLERALFRFSRLFCQKYFRSSTKFTGEVPDIEEVTSDLYLVFGFKPNA